MPTDPLTARLTRLREIAEAATPGEWEPRGLWVDAHGRGIIAKSPSPQNDGTFECSANARHIATFSPPLALALVECAEALAMVLQHGRIDDSEARMNQVAGALAKLEEHSDA